MKNERKSTKAQSEFQRRDSVLKELRAIPGVGKSISVDLYNLGVRRVADLRRKDPEKMYAKLMEIEGAHIDRCVLYVFRCAVYFASESRPRQEKLLWWNWKD